MVDALIKAGIAAGIEPGSIGIASPFRSQVALLQAGVDALALEEGHKGVEVLTIDRCQGRDKPALIVSLVRSNADRVAGMASLFWLGCLECDVQVPRGNSAWQPVYRSLPMFFRSSGSLLRDWRRVNVALTRARSKLILIGDSQTLSEIELFGRILALAQDQGGYTLVDMLEKA